VDPGLTKASDQPPAQRLCRNAEITVTIPAPADSPEKTDERTLHLGRDSQGVLLEVVTVPTENGVLIIHAMPMRPRYQKLL
jgi:hypothetical protein